MNLTEAEKNKIVRICEQNDISYCAMFGSFARGTADEKSDLDLLVRFSKPIGWRFYGIAEELEKVLAKRVDLATEPMLNRHIRSSVLSDLKVIYEKAD